MHPGGLRLRQAPLSRQGRPLPRAAVHGEDPDSLLESAKIEGCGEARIFRSIVLSLSKPLLATLGIMTFLGSWDSFLSPLIVLLDERKFTLPLVMAMLQGRFPGKDNWQMAGPTISILPASVLFAVFHRQIVQGLAERGLKEG